MRNYKSRLKRLEPPPAAKEAIRVFYQDEWEKLSEAEQATIRSQTKQLVFITFARSEWPPPADKVIELEWGE